MGCNHSAYGFSRLSLIRSGEEALMMIGIVVIRIGWPLLELEIISGWLF